MRITPSAVVWLVGFPAAVLLFAVIEGATLRESLLAVILGSLVGLVMAVVWSATRRYRQVSPAQMERNLKLMPILAAWVSVQAVVIFFVFAAATREWLLFMPLGFAVGLATGAITLVVWTLQRKRLRRGAL